MTEHFCHECEQRKKKRRPDLTRWLQFVAALASIAIKSGLVDISLLLNHLF